MVPDYSIPTAINFVDALKRGQESAFKNPKTIKSDIAFLQYTGGTTGVAKSIF